VTELPGRPNKEAVPTYPAVQDEAARRSKERVLGVEEVVGDCGVKVLQQRPVREAVLRVADHDLTQNTKRRAAGEAILHMAQQQVHSEQRRRCV
jgi:hypothetical protein